MKVTDALTKYATVIATNTAMRYMPLIMSLFIFSCIKKRVPAETIIPVDIAKNIIQDTISKERHGETCCYQDIPFAEIHQYPTIRDSAAFIKALRQNCHLPPAPDNHETISYFKRSSLYGTKQKIFIIEYDYQDNARWGYPTKSQFVFNSSGKLLDILSTVRVEPVVIFPGKHPFLLGVVSTAKGNGGHVIYRMSGDSLEQVLDRFTGNRPQTYDRHEDNTVNEPYEFAYYFSDVNSDGYNDILFSGKIKIIDPPEKKMLPATFVFVYNKTNGHFIPQENYSKKWEVLFGETWK
jgi:hypothetical protein